VSRNRTTVTNSLRLLELDDKIKHWIETGKLTSGHGRALLAVSAKTDQLKWAEEIIREDLSVRQIEERIYGPKKHAKQRAKSHKKGSRKPGSSPDLDSIRTALERVLGTKVEIRTAKKGGRIEIQYYSIDDFDRIIRLLGAK